MPAALAPVGLLLLRRDSQHRWRGFGPNSSARVRRHSQLQVNLLPFDRPGAATRRNAFWSGEIR